MAKSLIKVALGWGIALWLFGYILGFLFFALLPPSLIGWAIMPIGIAATLWVLYRKIPASTSLKSYFLLALVWTVIAIVCDYFLLVKLLNPADGYYKLDVYLYYLATFTLPLLVGILRNSNK